MQEADLAKGRLFFFKSSIATWNPSLVPEETPRDITADARR